MNVACGIPEANLFLLRESLYPGPWSSMSTPDRVLPSFINCTAIVEGFEGPLDSSNLALSDPAPGVRHRPVQSNSSHWFRAAPQNPQSRILLNKFVRTEN